MYLISQLEIRIWVLKFWSYPRQILLLDFRNNNFLSPNLFDFRFGNFLRFFNFLNFFLYSNKTNYYSWNIFNPWSELDNEVGLGLGKLNNLTLVLRTYIRHIFFYSAVGFVLFPFIIMLFTILILIFVFLYVFFFLSFSSKIYFILLWPANAAFDATCIDCKHDGPR